jgi:NADPH-dependent 2,4-dienoyl-CoA reductase/sulfur reductase-like enzyme
MSEEREQRRWIRILAIPMIAASAAMAAALSGSAWLMLAVVACGPGAGLAALLYLTFSSDTNRTEPLAESRHRVVVVDGGFAGVQVVSGLRRTSVDVTLIDRQNFTLPQRLVYQVAAGALSPAEVAMPPRWRRRGARLNVQQQREPRFTRAAKPALTTRH